MQRASAKLLFLHLPTHHTVIQLIEVVGKRIECGRLLASSRAKNKQFSLFIPFEELDPTLTNIETDLRYQEIGARKTIEE